MTESKEKIGIVSLVLSVLIPLVGIILYFVRKDKFEEPKKYLYAAVAGVAIGFVLNLII